MGLAVVALVGIGAAVAWFQPHKLFVDERVDEALPVAAASAEQAPGVDEPAAEEPAVAASAPDASTPDAPSSDPGAEPPDPTQPAPEPSGPVVVAEGGFTSLDPDTSGRAIVLDVGGDARVVRLEDLATDNGPDLFVYLSSAPLSAGEQALDDDVVDLGRLKGNLGSQNYEVPAGVDLDRYRTVVIWCQRFSSGFGAAELR